MSKTSTLRAWAILNALPGLILPVLSASRAVLSEIFAAAARSTTLSSPLSFITVRSFPAMGRKVAMKSNCCNHYLIQLLLLWVMP